MEKRWVGGDDDDDEGAVCVKERTETQNPLMKA